MDSDFINTLPRKYRTYLRQYSKEFCTAAVKKASKLISKKMQYAIETYYYEYNPLYYIRSYNLENNGFKPYVKLSGEVLEGGIKLDSNFLKPYKKKGLSMDSIYYRTIWNGEHGREKLSNRWRPIIISESPYSKIYRYVTTSKQLMNECSIAGFKAANKIKLPD